MKQETIICLVRIGYLLLIGGLMSGFVGYICLDLIARARRRFPLGKAPNDGEAESEFERFTLNQRIQHWVLIASFTTLVITGLPLTLPGWAVSRGLIVLVGGMGARAVIHRAAALVLIASCSYHLLFVLFSRQGYRDFRQLIPWLQDGRDILQMLRFYLGFSPVPARFGRYSFIQKLEYLAVGWGSVVMIATGALLWAPRLGLAFLPRWTIAVALIVHRWEAILAFLTIAVWHTYQVHANPSVFPMSRVWLNGKISLHELQESHPLEHEEMLRAKEGRTPERQAGARPMLPIAPVFQRVRLPFTPRTMPVWALLSIGLPAALFVGVFTLAATNPRTLRPSHQARADRPKPIAPVPATAGSYGADRTRLRPPTTGTPEPAHSSESVAHRPLSSKGELRASEQSTTTPHPMDWVKEAHGRAAQADRASCLRCHQENDCTKCHGLAIPHPDAWVSEHGKQAEAAPAKCSKCHTAERNGCGICHAGLAPSSHQKDSWKAQHSVAGAASMDLCELCHGKHACSSCHAAKGVKERTGR